MFFSGVFVGRFEALCRRLLGLFIMVRVRIGIRIIMVRRRGFCDDVRVRLSFRCSVCGLFIIIAFFVTIKFCIFFYWAFWGGLGTGDIMGLI